ncbi:MAG: hypothetical protein NZ602_13705 [Thermoguttaceae bacterium]|nr:hypothetical protein [Thermoguttaceae bacterium]MDW8037135.1 hypothetical protein [Thermoguttaceae bacterium]
MIRTLCVGLVWGMCLLFLTQIAWADGGLFGLPNPFEKSSTSKKSSSNLWGAKKPTLLDQIADGTKKAANATWDFVTLKWLWGQKPTTPSSQTPKLYERRKSSSNTKTNSSTNWWNSLWGKKDSSDPKTLSEWLSQKRPEP